jgi:tape measure domain-containing protein
VDIERIVVTLVADASQYNRVMASSVTTLTTTVRQMANMGPVFDAAVRVPIIAAAGAVGAVTVAAGAAVYQGIRLAASYEKAGIAFEVMTGSAERGRQMLEDINQLALATPFRSTELVEGAKELKAFGVGTENVIPALQALGDVSAGTGTSLGRLTLAFGQVMTVGHLTGQELRQFNNAGVPMAENLAAVMNKPIESIQHLVRQGKVGANDVIAAFNRMTGEGGTFNDMMRRLNDTVSGQWNTLVENLEFLARDMGTAFFEGTRLKDLLKSANSWFTGVREGMQGEGHGGWTEWFAQVRRNVEWLSGQGRAFLDVFKEGLNFEGIGEGITGIADRVREAFKSGEVDRFLADARAKLAAFFDFAGDRALIFYRTAASAYRGLVEVVTDFYRQGAEWAGRNERSIQNVAAVLAVVTAGVVAWRAAAAVVLPVYTAIRAAVVSVGAAMTAVNAVLRTSYTLTATFSATLASIQAAASFVLPTAVLGVFGVALGTLAAQWIDFDRTIQSGIKTAVDLFRQLADTASTVWDGFSAAMRANNPELAWKVVTKGIELGWKQTLNAMKAEWKRFKSEEFEDTEIDFGSGIRLAQNDFSAWMKRVSAQTGEFLMTDPDSDKRLKDQLAAIEQARKDAEAGIVNQNVFLHLVRQVEMEREMAKVKAEGVAGLKEELEVLRQQAKAEEAKAIEMKEQEALAKRIAAAQAEAVRNAQVGYERVGEAIKEAAKTVKSPLGSAYIPHPNAVVNPGMAAAASFMGLNFRDLPGAFINPARFPNNPLSAIRNEPTAPFNPLNPFGALGGGALLPFTGPVRKEIEKIFTFDAKVAELADKINKTFEDGVTDVQKLGTEIRRTFQAASVAPAAAAAAMGGAAAFTAGAQQITEEEKNAALFQDFQKVLGFVKDELVPKQPPTLTAGSTQAMDAINKANLESRVNELKVIDVLQQANAKHERQIAEAKRIADKMEEAARNGVSLVFKKIEQKK